MLQTKYFIGTLAEVEAAMNAYFAGLAPGAQVNASPLVLVPGTEGNEGGPTVIKEFLINLPARDNRNGAAAKSIIPARSLPN